MVCLVLSILDKKLLAAYVVSKICIGDLVDDAVRALITVYDEDDKMYTYDLKQYNDDPKKLLVGKPFQDMVKILQEKKDA